MLQKMLHTYRRPIGKHSTGNLPIDFYRRLYSRLPIGAYRLIFCKGTTVIEELKPFNKRRPFIRVVMFPSDV